MSERARGEREGTPHTRDRSLFGDGVMSARVFIIIIIYIYIYICVCVCVYIYIYIYICTYIVFFFLSNQKPFSFFCFS